MFILTLLGEWFIFWPLLLAFILVGGWTAENENYSWSGIMSILILALMYFAAPSLGALLVSPVKLGMIVGGYVVVGIVWATAKWYLKLKNTLSQFIGARDKYIRENKLSVGFFSTQIDETSDPDVKKHHKNFAQSVGEAMRVRGYSCFRTAHEARDAIQPQIWDNKSRVVTWGVYWPTSMMWFVLNDFVREIINAIYDVVSGKFQAMSDAMFRDAL